MRDKLASLLIIENVLADGTVKSFLPFLTNRGLLARVLCAVHRRNAFVLQKNKILCFSLLSGEK
jgi:uncharacterized protein (DUF2062 family)